MPKLCINPATTMPTDFVTDVRAFSAAGFKAMELWLDKVDAFVATGNSLSEAASLLSNHGLTVPAACAQGDLLLPVSDRRRSSAHSALRRKLAMCQSLACPTLVVPSDLLGEARRSASLLSIASANFSSACEIAAPYGVRLALEFIKGNRVASTLTEAQNLLQRVSRSDTGLVFDTFHFYAAGGRHPAIDELDVSSLAIVHVNDAHTSAPVAKLSDQDRTLLGRGSFPLAETFKSLLRQGYDGYFSLELFNPRLWEEDPFSLARNAHANLLAFLGPDEA